MEVGKLECLKCKFPLISLIELLSLVLFNYVNISKTLSIM